MEPSAAEANSEREIAQPTLFQVAHPPEDLPASGHDISAGIGTSPGTGPGTGPNTGPGTAPGTGPGT